jgi:AcrR family transcriptional regulator
MTVQSPAPERAGGRPRDPKLDRAILAAVLDLLAEEGYEHMSMESVAQRAGVGKPTIYRRWPSKQTMVIDALAGLGDTTVAPATGSARERMTELVEQIWTLAARAHSDRTTLLSHLVGEIHRSPELREAVRRTFISTRRRQVMAVISDGIESGELAAETDVAVVADLILSPLLARKLVTGGAISTAVGRSIVDTVFDGIARRPRGPKHTG